jgi:ATP-dependent exoDNAse (exonuclease V) beta subunit
MLGAADDEMDAAESLVRRLLDHPWMERARRAMAEGRCYREAPVTYRCDDGTLIEGTVDLAFDTGDEMVVIDFKTDRPDEMLRARYLRQVGWYAAAVARATGKRARGVLMLV